MSLTLILLCSVLGVARAEFLDFQVPSCPSFCSCDLAAGSLHMKCSQYSDSKFYKFFRNESLIDNVSRLSLTDSPAVDEVPASLCLLNRLESLDLSNNGIKNLRSLGCHNNLKTLKLAHNQIPSLEDGVLDGLKNLHSLILTNNKISKIGSKFFASDLQNLFNVQLDHNMMQTFDTWPFRLPAIQHSSLGNAVFFNLSSNRVDKFANSFHFHINELPFYPKAGLVIDLRYNQIKLAGRTVIPLVESLKINHIWDLLRVWDMGFRLSFNPYHCDCDMFYIFERLKPFVKMFNHTRDFPLIELKCSTPEVLHGTEIIEADLTKMNCPVSHQCPEGCNCYLTPANHTVSVICTHGSLQKTPTTLPQNASNVELYLSENRISHLTKEKYMNNLTYLDASNSHLQSIKKEALLALDNVETLLLNDNQIQYFPKDMGHANFTNLKRISISANDLICDCNTKWLKYWLRTKSALVVNIDDVLCSNGKNRGKAVYTLPDERFVCWEFNYPLFIEIICVCVAVVSIIGAVLVTYRESIRFRLLMRFEWRFLRFAYDQNKRFDVFISFCSENISWVRWTLLEGFLEAESPPYTVCIHQRDFLVGFAIAENIGFAVENARCTLLIVSRSYLLSGWCAYEFDKALNYSTNNPGVRIIAILLDEFEELEPILIERELTSLRNFLKSNTYVHMADSMLWKKLKYSLPIPVSPAPPSSEHSPQGMAASTESRGNVTVNVGHPEGCAENGLENVGQTGECGQNDLGDMGQTTACAENEFVNVGQAEVCGNSSRDNLSSSARNYQAEAHEPDGNYAEDETACLINDVNDSSHG